MKRCSPGPQPRSAIDEQAIAFVENGPDLNLPPRQQQRARKAQQHAYEQHLWQLCQPYVRTAAPQHTDIANAWNGSCLNSLSLWQFLEFPPTTISLNAAFGPWSLPAKSVGAPGVPKEVRPVWGLPPSLVPGWPSSLIPSTSVWLLSLPNLL